MYYFFFLYWVYLFLKYSQRFESIKLKIYSQNYNNNINVYNIVNVNQVVFLCIPWIQYLNNIRICF